ncbi:hypothetical protein O988_03529 [Pseudogymnoascus sp. VKM F-3808]|nr:hypothetical protein O988_03529 [Pseudogymnoascus sp. VKM F-3808]
MPLQSISEQEKDPSLHLPRFLCLHGGGSNAKIFRAQCRGLVARLKSHFRFVFADAPFLSQAGPCVLSVYASYAPFRRWLRWTPEQPEISAIDAVTHIEHSLWQAMDEDDNKGATGEWVGLMGFSQGAKMSASLLFQQQLRAEKLAKGGPESEWDKRANFHFAVLLAGQGPLVSLDPDHLWAPTLHDAATMTLSNQDIGVPDAENHEHMIWIPTIHVHGLRDPGLHLHRRLLDGYCEKGSTRLVEWDGDHRLPIKNRDVTSVVKEILSVSMLTGALKDRTA